MKDKLSESFFDYYLQALNDTDINDNPLCIVETLNILNESMPNSTTESVNSDKNSIKHKVAKYYADHRFNIKLSKDEKRTLDHIDQIPHDDSLNTAKDFYDINTREKKFWTNAKRAADTEAKRDYADDKLDRLDKTFTEYYSILRNGRSALMEDKYDCIAAANKYNLPLHQVSTLRNLYLQLPESKQTDFDIVLEAASKKLKRQLVEDKETAIETDCEDSISESVIEQNGIEIDSLDNLIDRLGDTFPRV